ncbi:MAG: hypothetical protein IH959_02940 [Chloroflexi bacterium]|nr:hypothetical protein [Chloroflexota bacterium]
MAERRLPFAAEDAEGARHQGELVIVPAWRAELELSPSAAFTIVLSQNPLDPDSQAPAAPNVIVCAPASRIRIPSAVAETTAAYGADTAAETPLRLSQQALEAYANGMLLAARPLSINARQVFGEGSPLDSLAQELLAGLRSAERYWQTLDEILSWPHPPAQAPRAERLRGRLQHTLDRASQLPPGPKPDAARRLSEIAAGAAPETVATSAAELREDVALVRCLAERREGVAEVAAMRAYLEDARPADQTGGLIGDHAFVREQLSFASLLEGPHQLESLRATFEMFRDDYALAYAQHHVRYWQAFARLRTVLDEADPIVQALARLNTLPALGLPVGTEALAEYERLMTLRAVCSQAVLPATLENHASCAECEITMADGVPTEEAEEVLHRLQIALARQQARLASEAVRRVLARGGERLDQFLQIVQASDLGGLTQVLDDNLLAFLHELLAEPVTATPEALGLFEELARTYPVISEEQVDAVLQTLRQLLTEQLAAQRETDPSRAASFRLAADPPPSP